MNTKLSGKRALVTGSVQGIGLAIAKTLSHAGVEVVLHGLPDEPVHAVARAEIQTITGKPAVSVSCDLADGAQIERMMDEVLQRPLDILVNNAGIQFIAPVAEMPRQKWDAILAINLSSAFDTMRLSVPGMMARGYGRIINIASVHGLVASINKAPYVASKFGLVGLTRAVALEAASAGSRESGGITANCICPGWTETAILDPQIDARAALFGGDRDAGIRDLLKEKQPSGRLSKPEDIAHSILWLCDPAAHNLTGTAIPIDGGWTAQ